MSHDSDLEEGEIPSSPSPSVSEKILPRRYILKENKSVHHKHKKDCKYAIRYHAKKIAKKMRTSTKLKDSYKNYKSRSPAHQRYKKSPRTKYHKPADVAIKSVRSNISNSFKVQPLVPKKKVSSKIDNDGDNISKIPSKIQPTSPNIKNEEYEDLEELRRIALASCSKRTLSYEHSCIGKLTNLSIDTIPISLDSNHVPITYENRKISDNYEVVDMEVDDDGIQNSVELVNNENLFIIDTKPSNFQADNKNPSPKPCEVQNTESDDDYEEEILRAELLSSILHKRNMNNEAVISTENVLDEKEPLFETFDKLIFKEQSIDNKNIELNSVISVPETCIVSPKRFIISLKEESSDESEQDDVPDNAVASLEALISDARQKSSLNENANDDVSNASEIVSCLSKAQQKEYSTLVKMLAKKNKLPQIPENEKKNSSPKLNDLKILEEKLKAVKENLKKEKELMTNLNKEVTEKYKRYVKSKLAAQLLKEKCIAAEKVRREKLALWSKSSKHFEVVKKSVSNLEKKITNLQDLYSKIGSSIQG